MKKFIIKLFKNLIRLIIFLFMQILIYPPLFFYNTFVGTINFLIPRDSFLSILKIVIIFQILAYINTSVMQNINKSILPLEYLPCFGITKDCETIRLIQFTAIMLFPLLFWNRLSFFGTVDCIDYDTIYEKMEKTAFEIKKYTRIRKIEQKLDELGIHDYDDREFIKKKILENKHLKTIKSIERFMKKIKSADKTMNFDVNEKILKDRKQLVLEKIKQNQAEQIINHGIEMNISNNPKPKDQNESKKKNVEKKKSKVEQNKSKRSEKKSISFPSIRMKRKNS